MKIGTKSVLFGAHQFLIHPLFVAAAWWRLYGFPRDPRLWVAFFIHDLGYIGKPNMDGPEGEAHPELGARIMGELFDGCRRWTFNGPDAMPPEHWQAAIAEYMDRHFGGLTPDVSLTWLGFTLYHSRFYAKKNGVRHSRLCVADKLATAMEPWWLYLPRVILTGEIVEYIGHKGTMRKSKYGSEALTEKERALLEQNSRRAWFASMTSYMRRWVAEHKDGRADTWTPNMSGAGTEVTRG